MFFHENHVQKAVNKVGGPTAASNQLGVSNAAIHKWINAQRVPNIDKARKLAELSGIALENVRPI